MTPVSTSAATDPDRSGDAPERTKPESRPGAGPVAASIAGRTDEGHTNEGHTDEGHTDEGTPRAAIGSIGSGIGAAGTTPSAVDSGARLAWRGMRLLLMVFAALVALHWVVPPFYDPPAKRPFAGRRWYDPYAPDGALHDAAPPRWQKANLHQHSIAWGGFTNGEQAVGDVLDHYRDAGYAYYTVSNYQSLAREAPGHPGRLEAYEHGFSIGAQHFTVVGPRSVSWAEFLLFQDFRQKQFMIDHLEKRSELLIVNHPNRRGSFAVEDFDRLTGYDALEIGTKYARATEHWDRALSAGRPVWGICADDGHDLERSSHSGIGWIEIDAPPAEPVAAIDAIRRGRFYSVFTRKKSPTNAVEWCGIENGALVLRLAEPAELIRFIGQGGRELSAMHDTRRAEQPLAAEDTYVRAEAYTRGTVIYLNPVFRFDRDPLASKPARIDPVRTWSARLAGAWGWLFFVLLLHGVIPRGRRRSA